MNIYSLLSSKPHNKHYLNRYFKFILYCTNRNLDNDIYTECHHICPKDKNLFPQFKSFKENPWNKIILSAREHYIAHWILWKCYGNGQTYAFKAMHNQKSKFQQKRFSGYSYIYEKVKKEGQRLNSEKNKGFATYYDISGNTIRTKTTDKRVLSGELISTSKGRKYKPRTKQQKEKVSKSLKNFYKDKTEIYLYKGIEKIKVLKYSENTQLLLDNGWSKKATKEYKAYKTSEFNKKRTRKFSKKAKDRLRLLAKNAKKGKESHQYGKFWITNGKDSKMIKEEEFSLYKEKGFYKGRTISKT